MSKYRNALQQVHTLGLNKVNTDSAETSQAQNIKQTTVSTTNTLASNKIANASKVYRKKLSFDKVLLVLSRIHNSCNLRFQTFCLAIQLYRKYMGSFENPEEEDIQCGYLMLACMFLAMKYYQIYHPSLKEILKFIPTQLISKFNFGDYMQYEVLIFCRLGSSMDVKTAKVILDQLMQSSSQETYFYAYYLLEIAYNDKIITQKFTTEEICKAIYLTMQPLHTRSKKMRQFKGVQIEELVYCSKQLISRKSKHTQQQSPIYMKYSREKYMKIALLPYVQIRLEDI